MPFQITLVTISHNVPPEVSLDSAGNDQLHICTPVITLTAEIGGDLTGHTLLWEQLEGTNVFLLTPFDISTDFAVVDQTDKKFRFWIDKGLPSAQFDDMWVRKTPQSHLEFSEDAETVVSFERGLTPGPPVDCDDILSVLVVTAPAPSTPEGEEPLGPTLTITVSWEHPGTAKDTYLYQYLVYENGVNIDALPAVPPADIGEIGSGPPSGPLETVGSLSVFRIDSLYNISGYDFTLPSCDKDFTGTTIPSTKIYNDTFMASQDVNTVSSIRTDFGFIVLNKEESLLYSQDVNAVSLIRTNFGFIVLNEEESLLYSQDVTQLSINITRFDPQGIGT